jgi:golgi phosphoprotein 3
MSSAGLSRRRVAGSSANSATTSTDDHSSIVGTSVSHAGSAFEGGNKIAYDPRDLQEAAGEESRQGGKAPKLTIMEEVLLLGIKDKQVRETRK